MIDFFQVIRIDFIRGVQMIEKQNKMREIEILAPAGSYDSFLAALAAGADAVYAGGSRFGARAYAENFSEELLLKAIDYAHLHGRKFYLTVNTLLKDSEIQDLGDYLRPFYEGGLDAVIVQDLGVLEYVRTYFPDLEIHASTQMTITAPEGARFLQREGVSRVVPARELSLSEIRNMKTLTGMEIECFVHGALCYCYSGQCLLSSMIGGRSGNRGQCAQPCRLPYTIKGEKAHWLSPKDICTLELIPDLVDAGIDSFKIEGRMKRPEYVAGVTLLYRKYLDLYLEKGRKDFSVTETDKEMLLDLYNRGGFHSGYYKQHNGINMLSLKRPNHAGVPAVEVKGQKGREVIGKALTSIGKGDVLELRGKQDNYTFGKSFSKGENVSFLVPKGMQLAPGIIIYRTKNEQLLRRLSDTYGSGKIKERIHGFLSLSIGEYAKFIVTSGEIVIETFSTQKIEAAAKSPLDEMKIRKQMLKTGNTEFEFEQLEIEIQGEVFLPMQQLNELRRRALELLERAVCEQKHRSFSETEVFLNKNDLKEKITKDYRENDITDRKLSVLVETKEQLRVLDEVSFVKRIYVDSALGGDLLKDAEALKICRTIQRQGREIFLALPHIFREDTEKQFLDRYTEVLDSLFDGVLVRNIESLSYLKKSGFDRKLILDHNLYVFNQYTKQFWKSYCINEFTMPLELNQREYKRLGTQNGELLIYGYLPVMISAQCVTNSSSGCKKQEGIVKMKDRTQNTFFVRNHCRECYNVIYNSTPLFLLDKKEEIDAIQSRCLRLQFSIETGQETMEILEMYRKVFLEQKELSSIPEKITRGHFNRGVL